MEGEGSSAVERMLEWAQSKLDRVRPEDLDAEVAAGALVVDMRPESNRAAEGELPGALVVERIVLEWRLDPTSPWRLPESERLAETYGRVVLVCNEGYSSSLAALALRDLGLARATDLVGGYRAWRAIRG